MAVYCFTITATRPPILSLTPMFTDDHANQKMADPVAKLQLLEQLELAEMLKQVSPCRTRDFLSSASYCGGCLDLSEPQTV